MTGTVARSRTEESKSIHSYSAADTLYRVTVHAEYVLFLRKFQHFRETTRGVHEALDLIRRSSGASECGAVVCRRRIECSLAVSRIASLEQSTQRDKESYVFHVDAVPRSRLRSIAER